MSNQNQKFTTGHPVTKNAGIRPLIVKYFPFLPYIFMAAVMGLIFASIYLRYEHQIYEIKARIVINEDIGSQDKSEGKIQLSLEPKSNSTQERQVEVIHSTGVMTIVVKKLGLYADIENQGLFVKNSLFGSKAPLSVLILNPDLIRNEVILPVVINTKLNSILLNGKAYPMGQLCKSPYGDIRFILRQGFIQRNDYRLSLHLTPPVKYAERMSKTLRITPKSKESNIVDLTFDDEVPERALLTVNEIIHVYDSIAVTKQRESSQNVINFINQRLAVVANDLNSIELELQSYKSIRGISNLPAEGQIHFARIEQINLENGLINKQENILDQLERYMNARNLSKKNIPAIVELTSPGLNSLVLQLFQAEVELERLGKISGPSNPQVLFTIGQISKLRPAIAESIHNLRIGYNAAQKLNQLEIDKSEALLREVPLKEKKLVDITRRLEVKNGIYTYLLQKREETEVSSVANTLKTQILEGATIAGLISSAKEQVYVLCLIGAIALAMLIITMKESLNFAVTARTDFEHLVGAPIIGELGLLRDKEIGLLVMKDSTTIISEQFRDLRSNLHYLNVDNPKKITLVTSSIMGEGKSMISLNIALALSIVGKKVLIMELDLRRPKISKQIKISPVPGISNYLIGDNQISEIIRPVPGIDNLFIASCGNIAPNPTELILSTRMEELMKKVEVDFDHVIIDSPPVGIVTDAKLLALYASSTLFVIRERVTPLVLLSMIAELKNKNILPHIAIVYNAVKSKKFLGYKYGYRYGSGYSSDGKV